MGIIYYEADFFDEAIQAYEQAMKLSNQTPDHLHNMSLCYFKKGDMKNATAYFNAARKLKTEIQTNSNKK